LTAEITETTENSLWGLRSFGPFSRLDLLHPKSRIPGRRLIAAANFAAVAVQGML
jgi:hypothetical protein